MNLTDSNLELELKLFDSRREDTIVSSDAQSGWEDERARFSGRLRLEVGWRLDEKVSVVPLSSVRGEWMRRQTDRLV